MNSKGMLGTQELLVLLALLVNLALALLLLLGCCLANRCRERLSQPGSNAPQAREQNAGKWMRFGGDSRAVSMRALEKSQQARENEYDSFSPI